MVSVYVADISNLQDPMEQPGLLVGLSKTRAEKILQNRQVEARRQSLGAGLLLKEALARRGRSMEEVTTGAHGKPQIEGLCFNLSHTKDLVLCAVSSLPVGCDTEKIKKARMKAAGHFFCESEYAYLQSFVKEEEQNDAFFRLWTMKESYMKMTGEGMGLGLSKFEIRLDKEHAEVFRNGEKVSCYIREYEVPGYKVTVCAKEAEMIKEPVIIRLGEKME